MSSISRYALLSASWAGYAMASLCTCVVAVICKQDEVADAAASVFWTSLTTAVGTWAAEEIQEAIV
ncbi:MAG: hypothetical protein IPN27_09750 [Cellvibrionales bacterium]|nr:hypothetical protein [Cellvibrionales bacterium]